MTKQTSLIKQIRAFNQLRDWEKFHTPKNLSMALAGEVGELVSHFQWLNEKESFLDSQPQKLAEVKEEIADVYLYLLMLSDSLGIDLNEAAEAKLEMNKVNYPVAKSKGNAKKYTEL